MRLKPPVLVTDLFPEERLRLLDILRGLSLSQWGAATSCPGWSVKDIAAHVLGVDLNNLSAGRDGHKSAWFDAPDWESLVAYINARNEAWVEALRRLSPRVIIDLLDATGDKTAAYFKSLDPMAPGPNVAWAGTGPSPMWLHVAREYTERWLYQMQVPEAVGAQARYERRLFHPVLDAFVHALPVAYAATTAAENTLVAVVIEGDGGGGWVLARAGNGWHLVEETAVPAATVRLDQETAWKLWTKELPAEEARPKVMIEGDSRLAEPVLQAVAIIA